MLLEGVLLSEVVHVLTAEGVVSKLRLIEILSLEEKLVVAVLETGLEFADLSSHIEVAGSSKLILLAEFIVVG